MKANLLVAIALAAATLAPIPASAQQKAQPPDEESKWTGTLGVVKRASSSLGIQRVVNPGDEPGRAHGVTGFYAIYNGTMFDPQKGATAWPQYKIDRLATELCYIPYSQGISKSPGARWDFNLMGPDGKKERRVLAVAAGLSWNEKEPGIGGTAAADAASTRMQEIWLTPFGLIWAALTPNGLDLAPGVTDTKEGGKTVLNIPINGVPAKVTLNSDLRPEKIETRTKHPVLGDVPLEITYSDYKDFERAYWVYYPEHIVEKVNGKTVLDLTTTEFHTNAYVIFPVPASVLQAVK